VAQTVGNLLCKRKAPSSNPQTHKKKKKKSRPGWATSQRQNENTKLPVLSILKRKKKK
jgi:hypothetical protein